MKLIFKLLKSLISILLLTSLIVMLFIWASLSEEKRYQLSQKLDAITPFNIFELSHQLKSTLKNQLDKTNNPFVEETLSILSNSDNPENSHFHFLEFDCSLPQTKQLQKTKSHKIYQWTDAQGRVHFTDSSEQQDALDISEQYKNRYEYITLNIQPINAVLPLDLHNDIRVSTTKMFMVLSDAVKVEQLHQLELSLKLFGNPSDFQFYLAQKAPNLKQAAGFYLAKDNEASVLMQNKNEQTMTLIRHESSHVMMANLYGLSPIWLNEGFAEYFQGLKVSGFETSIYPNPYQLQLLLQAKQANELSLKRHFDLSVQEWQGQNIQQHYAEAWSIIYFLLSHSNNKSVLSEYMSQLSVDRCVIPNSTDFFENNYPGGITAMNTDWLLWLSQSEIHPHRY